MPSDRKNAPRYQADLGTTKDAVLASQNAHVLTSTPGSEERPSPKDEKAKEAHLFSRKLKNYFSRARLFVRIFTTSVFSNAAVWNAIASITVAGATVFYTVYSHRQWIAMSGQIEVMRDANGLTQRALTGSDLSLEKTLTKMQAQVDAMTTLAKNAGIQATQTTNLAVQTHTLADTSGKQVTATQRFADAAGRSADTAGDAMYLEQRAWVGIEVVPAVAPAGMFAGGPGVQFSAVMIVAHNTGKTPALRWNMECCEQSDQTFPDPIPDYDVMKKDVDSHLSSELKAFMRTHPGEAEKIRTRHLQMEKEFAESSRTEYVIPPNGTKSIDFSQGGGNDHNFHFRLGRFTYRDILNPTKEHVTKFCLMSLGNGQLRLCDRGQDMN